MTNLSGLIPVEFHVVVELDPLEEKTVGGIILPTEKLERDELAATEATLVAVSPLAFTYEQWPEGSRKPVVGDRVLFKRHTGWLHKKTIDGVERRFRILNDKEIVAIIGGQAEVHALKVVGS